MSLLDEAFESFTVMNKSKVDDGYGGVITTWTEGANVKGAMVFNGSAIMRVAEAVGSTSSYTFTCKKELQFDFHDVLKRASDGKIFRLTSNSDELKTPASAGLDMRQYQAEEIEVLPT